MIILKLRDWIARSTGKVIARFKTDLHRATLSINCGYCGTRFTEVGLHQSPVISKCPGCRNWLQVKFMVKLNEKVGSHGRARSN